MKKPAFYFYSNPHQEYAWTKCPKCDNKTKARKFYLMIHYQDKALDRQQLFSLGKTCKFCPYCNLIIANKWETEIFLQQMLSELNLSFKPDNYMVFGTIDRQNWKQGMKSALNPAEALKEVIPFKDVWDFEIRPAGWYLDDKA